MDVDQQLFRIPVSEQLVTAPAGSVEFQNFLLATYRPTLVFNNGLGGKIIKPIGQLVNPAQDVSDKPYLQSVDWGQSVIKSNPLLIPDREALLRLHVVSDNPEELPEVLVEIKHNEEVTKVLTALKPDTLLDNKVHDSLEYSYLVTVPSDAMQVFNQFDIKINNETVTTLKPSFSELLELEIVIVPLIVNGLVPTIPELDEIENHLIAVWPFSKINITMREPYTVTSDNPIGNDTLLSVVSSLWAQEVWGTQIHYYGVFHEGLGLTYGGLARLGQPYSTGYDNFYRFNSVMAHELGHNFGRNHVECGLGDFEGATDKLYPYDPATLGSVGIAGNLNELYKPEYFTDLMSYCSPHHISDYNFEIVQDRFNRLTKNSVQEISDQPVKMLGKLGLALFTEDNGILKLTHVVPVSKEIYLGEASALSLESKTLDGQSQRFTLRKLEYGHGEDLPKQYSVLIPDNIIVAEVQMSGKQLYSFSREKKPMPLPEVTLGKFCLQDFHSQYDSVSVIRNTKSGKKVFPIQLPANQHCYTLDENVDVINSTLILTKGLNFIELNIERSVTPPQ